MIKISGLRLPATAGEAEIKAECAKRLGIAPERIERFGVARMSIDARRGREVSLVCSAVCECADEARLLRRGGKDIAPFEKKGYARPPVRRSSGKRPVVVGMGPAGLFAALYLAEAGFPSIVLERGGDIDSRAEAVERHWRTGVPDARSNVQFGEGGAGAFSDGKLTTGTHDMRSSAVIDTLVRFGAPEDIQWSNRPHVGTDILRGVVKNIRNELIRLGCEVRFDTAMTGLELSPSGELRAVLTEAGRFETDAAVLAIGHSARDGFAMLQKLGLELAPKPFSVGVRIEHSQAAIGFAQYGELYERLPPADYRLAEHLENGRSVYSFCVCPGGVVVASASEPDGIVTNGMSYRARDGANINGALLVNVTPDDFPDTGALAGVEFQRELEQRAFRLGGANGYAPAQTVGDFLAGKPSERGGAIIPSYRPGVRWTAIDEALPDFASESLRMALPRLGRKVRGFDAPEAVLTGVETRSSSPVRIVRGDALCATRADGVYPCGEGAGYAGGIVSAAVDGIRAAEAIFTRET